MAGRGRGGGVSGYQWGNGYNYAFDYGRDSAGSYNFMSNSWMNTYPMSSSDGAKHMGLGRDSSSRTYNRLDRGRYGFSQPERSYGNWRSQQSAISQQSALSSQSSWRGNARAGFRANFRPSPIIRGPERPMSQLNKSMFSESSGFQSLKAFTGNSYFGGGFKKPRKNWRGKKTTEDRGPPEKKTKANTEDNEAKSKEDNGVKIKEDNGAKSKEDNGAKSEESESEGDGDQEAAAATSTKTDANDKHEETEGTDKEEKKQKLTPSKKRLRHRMLEKIQFVCSLCKFRSFYNEEMTSHLKSEFHKEHFRYVSGKVPKQTADFLQEYIVYKAKKAEERRESIEGLGDIIHQIYKDQDLTHDLGMEHFVKKVEVAHCAACDVVIPMTYEALEQHMISMQHNQNRRKMMENSKRTSLTVVRSILNNKLINEKLERFIKGQNPFTDDPDEGAGSSAIAMETTIEDLEATTTEDSTSEQTVLQESSASTSSAKVVMETESSGQFFDTESIKEDDGDSESGVPIDEEQLGESGIVEDSLCT